jgi:DNA adenine methylase
LNDVPEMRELFAWATIDTVELSYQAGGGATRSGCGRW